MKSIRITVFRIDRIADISLTESIAIPCPKDFVLKGFIAQTFKMFSGELMTVTFSAGTDPTAEN